MTAKFVVAEGCQKKNTSNQKLAIALYRYTGGGSQEGSGLQASLWEFENAGHTLYKRLRCSMRTDLALEKLRQLANIRMLLICPLAPLPVLNK